MPFEPTYINFLEQYKDALTNNRREGADLQAVMQKVNSDYDGFIFAIKNDDETETLRLWSDLLDDLNISESDTDRDLTYEELVDIYGSVSSGQGLRPIDSPTFAGLTITNNIAVGGTIDGRDISVDGAKLDTLQSTLGDLTTAEIQQLQNIDTVIISSDQWRDVGGLNQGLNTADDVAFNTVDGRDISDDGVQLDDNTLKLGEIENEAEKNTLTSVGGTYTLVSPKIGSDLRVRGFNAGAGVTFTLQPNGSYTLDATGAGGGQSNEGANVGASGVGVYDGMNGILINMRKLNPVSNRISIALNSQQIDFDINEANIDIENTTGNLPNARVVGLDNVATSGLYTDLSSKPFVVAGVEADEAATFRAEGNDFTITAPKMYLYNSKLYTGVINTGGSSKSNTITNSNTVQNSSFWHYGYIDAIGSSINPYSQDNTSAAGNPLDFNTRYGGTFIANMMDSSYEFQRRGIVNIQDSVIKGDNLLAIGEHLYGQGDNGLMIGAYNGMNRASYPTTAYSDLGGSPESVEYTLNLGNSVFGLVPSAALPNGTIVWVLSSATGTRDYSFAEATVTATNDTTFTVTVESNNSNYTLPKISKCSIMQKLPSVAYTTSPEGSTGDSWSLGSVIAGFGNSENTDGQSIVVGMLNYSKGNCNAVFGRNNRTEKGFNLVGGADNQVGVLGSHNIIGGEGNDFSQGGVSYSLIGGLAHVSENVPNKNYMLVAGVGHKMEASAQTLLGEFSVTTANTALVIGDGASDGARSNIFEITKDDQILSSGFSSLLDRLNTASMIKNTTGDPSSPNEGDLTANTVDNAIKWYVDGGWRTLATW